MAAARKSPTVLIWLAAFALNLSLFWSLIWPPDRTQASQETLTILHANAGNSASKPQKMLSYLQNHPADIVLLQDITEGSLAALAPGLNAYEIAIANPLPNSHGSVMLVKTASKIKVTKTQIYTLDKFSKRPLILASITFDNAKLQLMSTHITRPAIKAAKSGPNRELNGLADWAILQNEAGISSILIGDFNSTPTSQQFRKFLAKSGYVSSQNGYPLQQSWPADVPLLFRVAIDNAIHSPDLVTISQELGPDTGSDHLPLVLTLARRAAN